MIDQHKSFNRKETCRLSLERPTSPRRSWQARQSAQVESCGGEQVHRVLALKHGQFLGTQLFQRVEPAIRENLEIDLGRSETGVKSDLQALPAWDIGHESPQHFE